MPNEKVTVNAQGRVTIPNSIRQELGIEPGTQLVIYIENGRLIAELPDRMLRRVQQELAQARTAQSGETTDARNTEIEVQP